ncbi:MAG TPA: SatD family protein [Verrucomicrobiae bacterium]|nr:SatD family protein [Verrucomicrobiae bacterium]
MKSPYGVLLADVVASGRQKRLREILGEALRRASLAHQKKGWIRVPYAITAGDEFQAVVPHLERLPELILDLRRRLRPLNLRLAAGAGAIHGPVRAPVNRMQGEAFVRARQAMDELKSGRLHKYPAFTAFRTGNPILDRSLNLIYGLNDTLLRAATLKQWQAMEAHFQKQSVKGAARALGLDESTVSRRLSRGHYWQIVETAQTVKIVLHSAFSRLPSRRQS